MIFMESVTFSYGKSEICSRLSINIPTGEIFGLVGASGSGKTTIMRLLIGSIRPDYGHIEILGKQPSHSLCKDIGYMPQSQALYKDLTVQHNIDFFARMFGIGKPLQRIQVVERILDNLSLWDQRNTLVDKLSGGQRQRVSLAIALVHSPQVLILDEPTVGLDPRLRVSLWKYFHSLAREGVTIIVSTHVMEDARRCGRIGLLHSGRIMASGSPGELMAKADNSSNLEDAFLYLLQSGKTK